MTNLLSRTTLILAAVAAISFGLQSCAGKKKGEGENDKVGDRNITRQQHAKDSTEVEIMVLRSINFKRQLGSNGKLRAKTKATVNFRTPGIVQRIHVANGSYVRKGDIIATLDNEEALSSLKTSKLAMRKAEIDLNDAIIGFGYSGVGDSLVPKETMELAKLRSGYNSVVLSLEKAETALANCTLRAPFAGRIANLKGHEYDNSVGEFCVVIDDSRMMVDFSILETEYDFVKPGQTVKVESFFDAENKSKGVVKTVNPSIDKNGQIVVEAEIANDGRYIDGMNVKLFLEKEVPDQLVVPKSAVVIRDNLQVLFTYSGGKAKWVYVETVMENSDSYAVRPNLVRAAELSAGDTVIVGGNLNIAHDTPVIIKQQ